MSLEELRASSKVIGAKQVKKAISKGLAKKVYLAVDAEPHIIEPIKAMCIEHGVDFQAAESMKKLGEACGIDVGSAAVAIVL
ncbi:MAG: ribosomal L7Ae/L30e/S12e/Gadd45 family protein [Syntrophomonadaceae bacterium]